MTDNRLKSLAERIERLMDERDGIQSDIREIYVEAKSAGYVPKVLRKAITRKRMDPDKRSEEDTILDLYEDALSPTMRKVVAMAKAGANSRDIEAATGVDHATVARSVALKKESATGEITTAGLDTPPVGSGDLIEGHSSAAPDSDATGNSAHEGEGNGHRNDRDGERRGSEELQPERQSGRGGHQGDDGVSRVEDGADSGPQQRHGGTRGGGGNHQSTDSQHVVRLGGDEGFLAAWRGVDAPSTPPLGAVAEAQPERVARQDDGLDIPPFLRRQRASA